MMAVNYFGKFGVIDRLYKSHDKIAKSVDIKTENCILKRSIEKLNPLEYDTDINSDIYYFNDLAVKIVRPVELVVLNTNRELILSLNILYT